MPQHLWLSTSRLWRICEVCWTAQVQRGGEWTPPVSTICPGDDDDDRPSGPRRRRPKPLAPSDAPESTPSELAAVRRMGREVARSDDPERALAWGFVVLLRRSGRHPTRELIDRVVISGGASTTAWAS